MKIIFNELGVITSIDTTDEPIRQGNVGVNNLIVDFSNMNGVNNLDYACVFTYVRPDKSKINDVIMLSSAENTKYFEFNFSNKWFFELYGDASITVKLLKDNTVLANGEFNIVIEKTSADNEPQITYDEYLHLVESIAKTQQDAKQYTDDSVQALKDLVNENYAEKTYVDNQLNLCVKLTDIDTDLSLTSTNPIQNKVVSKQIKDINYTIMTMKEELFETVLSEVDYKVDYATIYPIPDTLSDDDGTHRVVYSDTQFKEVEGNSVAFNQLVNMPNGSLQNYQGNANSLNKDITFDPNHYYLFKVNVNFQTQPTPTYCVLLGMWSNDGSWYRRCLFTYQSNGIYQSILLGKNLDGSGDLVIKSGLKAVLQLYGNSTDTTYPQYSNSQIIDLTQMFGAGNEPTTVEEFNRIFPLTYYPYNAGEIKSTVIKGVKVNGYNLFNNTADNWNALQSNAVNTKIIKVIGGKSYTLEPKLITNANISFIVECDENRNMIKSNNVTSTGQITLLSNTQYVFIQYNGSFSAGVVPQDNICFHLTGSRTGYAPYKEPHIINIPQTNLPSAGSVHDTIKIVEGNIVAGQQRYDMVYVSKGNSVDLGTLNFYVGSDNRFTCYVSGITNFKTPISNDVKANILCSKYTTYTADDFSINKQDKSISCPSGTGVLLTIKDTSYTDITTFKTAMSGVMLNYEKNEYTETTLATDLTFEEVSAIIEQGGSIETVFEIVPPNLKTAFVVNKAIVS